MIAFLLPGQGCYQPGAFAGQYPADLGEVFETADRVAAEFDRPGISQLLRRADAPAAAALAGSDPFALQLAIFAAGLAWYRLGLRSARPDLLIGHSMGEITALTAAGVFDLADGARLVCHRSLALQTRCPEPGGMLAVRMNARRAAALVELVDQPGLALAVSNAPGQSVLSGPHPALAQATAAAQALGAAATVLPAPYPYHSPALVTAALAFAAAIGGIGQRPLQARVYSPVAGRYLDDRFDAKQLLVDQLTRSVDFLGAIRRIYDDGVRTFLECGPVGLAGQVRRSVPDVQAEAVQAPASPAFEPSGAYPAAAPFAAGQPWQQASQPIYLQPAAGLPALGQPDFGRAAATPPVPGQPAHQPQPTLANPYPAGQSSFGQAPFGQPQVGQSFFGQAPFGQPSFGQPSFGQPNVQPVTANPIQPSVIQPARVELNGTAPAQPSTTPNQPNQPVQPNVQPTQPAGLSRPEVAEVLAELVSLYADSLGYPAEAVSADADLEADLGIDSLKRAEMLGKVRAHFGLVDAGDDGRFLAQSTLAELAELVAAAR